MILEKYLAYVKQDRSANTYRTYKASLKKWFPDNKANFKEEYIFGLIGSWNDCGYNKNTIKQHVISLTGLIIYCQEYLDMKIDKRLIKRLKKIKGTQTDPAFISMDKINTVAKTIPEIRYKLLFLLMAHAGLRAVDALSLNLEDINEEYVTVKTTKGKTKERTLPLSPALRTAYKEYLPTRKKSDPKALFTTTHGRLKYVSAYKKLKPYIKHTGQNLSPHALRHSFATHILSQGHDIETVRQALGHSRIANTQRYLHTTQDKMDKLSQSFGG